MRSAGVVTGSTGGKSAPGRAGPRLRCPDFREEAVDLSGEVLGLRRLGELRQSGQDFLFGEINILQALVEKLVEFVKNKATSKADQRKQLDLLAKLNGMHQGERPNDPQLEARIQSFELASRMQTEAGDAFDITREPLKIREAYGDSEQARSLLLARRLIERGVSATRVMLRFGRDDSHRHWVVASGESFDEAFRTGLRRMRLFDEAEGPHRSEPPT